MAGSGFHQTFAELDAAANRLSQAFRSRGLHAGDHVAICLENHDRFCEIVWGCRYAGLIYTTCSSRLTSGELVYIVNDCRARAFITSLDHAVDATAVVESCSAVTVRLMLDGTIDSYEAYESVVNEMPAEPLGESRPAGMDMLYSSGTTGKPKGVLRPFQQTFVESAPAGAAEFLRTVFSMKPDSVYLSPAPLYHAAPLRFMMGAQALGCPVVVMKRFDARDFLSLVDLHRVTHTQVVPTMFVRMLKLDTSIRNRFDLSSLECVIHAAAPCPISIKRQMIDWLGPVIHEYYAGTEGNGFVHCDSRAWLDHPGTVGKALNCSVHILDENHEELPRYEVGTVFFEGGGTFEYLNDPIKTASSRARHGWTTLGDIGYVDDDGYLYLTDRSAYTIISGGVNVYPQEAEDILISHPLLVDAAVFGVPNEDLGEEVKAVVQPLTMPDGDAASTALADELVRFCRSQLADVKCPRSVDFRPELPRDETGKLYKRVLRAEYWKAAGRET
jgi:acyl-CoA synthetase (AMP-forming)/AMP-acid ligase II